MDSNKMLPVLFVAASLVFTLSNHVTEGMYLGGIIAHNKAGLGFHGNFKAAAALYRKINLGSSEEEFLETNKLNEQGNKVEEDNSSADTPTEVFDSSVESNQVAQNSDEEDAVTISTETVDEPDIDNNSDKFDVGDNDSDENKFISLLVRNSDTDDNDDNSDVLVNLEETSTNGYIGADNEPIYIGDAQPDSGYDYLAGKNNDLGEGFSNDDYYVGNEDHPIIGFAIQRSGGRPVLDYGYYNFDSDNYAKNLI